MPSRATPIEFKEVSFSYGDRRILVNTSFRVEPGESVAVVGPSGSGKSTLLHLASGLLSPDSGEVLVDGLSTGSSSVGSRSRIRRSQIGIVLQDASLLEELTARENIELVLRDARMGRSEARRVAMAALDRVGLKDVAGNYPHELSGGEAQRVAVGRALAKSPMIVLADEPTGSLDASTTNTVASLLYASVRSALLVVTHDDAVARRADQILTLDSQHPQSQKTDPGPNR
ncbi:MAG: ATP-binding cassette domain-containing protein [Actinomycetia bacterium]|nr:ATP-binding cassette domain-containing protein [Actinomycetes bacterium]